MRLTRCYPVIKNREIVSEFFENGKDQKAMFVANHCSWMDIPFLGATMGWRNYKIIAKKELGIVPILGAAIRVGGHIMVARDDRRSQIKTLKQGINYLKVRTVTLYLSIYLFIFVVVDSSYMQHMSKPMNHEKITDSMNSLPNKYIYTLFFFSLSLIKNNLYE